MADRFYFDGPLSVGELSLDGSEAHHLANVRRLQPGTVVTLFNGDGHEYLARIVDVSKRSVNLLVESIASPNRELPTRLHIAAAMPKGDRGDFLIEKLTELGVAEFTPLITERSVVNPSGKEDKLRRAVIEASKQCGRNRLMQIHATATWAEWHRTLTGARWIAHPGASSELASGDATIAIGPEGGFSEADVAIAIASGWQTFNLGPRFLRVETAAIASAVIASKQS